MKPKAVRGRRARSLVVPILVLAALCGWYLYEHGYGFFGLASPACTYEDAKQNQFPESLAQPIYKWLVGRRFQNSRVVDNVVTVSIGQPGINDAPNPEQEYLTNTCASRVFIAQLIAKLATHGPKAIVVDKFYGVNSCNDRGANEKLQDALHNSTVPIVLGEHTLPSNEGDCLKLDHTFDFKDDSGKNPPHLSYGLIRLNANPAKLPLGWRVLDMGECPLALRVPAKASVAGSPADPSHTSYVLSLAMAASLADTQGVTIEDRLDKLEKPLRSLIDRDEQPYASLIFPHRDHQYRASNLLCYSNESRFPCLDKGGAIDPEILRGKWVVIGDYSEDDIKHVLGATYYGFELQAAYIETILNHRYLVQTPPVLDVFALALWIVAFYVLHICCHPNTAMGISIVLLLALMIGYPAYWLAHNRYTPVWTEIALVIFLIEHIAEDFFGDVMKKRGLAYEEHRETHEVPK